MIATNLPSRVRLARLAGAILLLVLVSTLAARAEPLRGVALVIGNSDYVDIAPLANPANDARAMEALLAALGFETTLALDRDARRLSRDLRDFGEDADGADVAVLFYAGHGIEAGGENFLVPVDAGPAALDAAGERLVPLSAIVAELQTTVPVTILMLDACRDNPFPRGATLRLTADAAPAPVSANGLGETRGVARMSRPARALEDFGTVIAFAAAPGQAALDGPQGGNSPYTTALLRHFDTMAGTEFGIVMRMVAEEVYLKTSGRQRPWVNENLRRRLYLGATPAPAEGPEGTILSERRRLLLTIAELPDIDRLQVERVAVSGGVPMDAVFAILGAMGAEAPEDPVALDRLLRTQAANLRDMMAFRAVLTSADPELTRLSNLAALAVSEGALSAAIDLNEQAKARVSALAREVDTAEDAIRARRIEFAAIHAESAATYELVFDHASAAEDYEAAYRQVERWDDALAWDYLRRTVIATYRHGEYRRDRAALERVLARSDEIVLVAARTGSRMARAEAHLQIGNSQYMLARQRASAALYEEAAIRFQEAIALFEEEGDRHGLARAKNNLANVLSALGGFEGGSERIEEAVSILAELVAETPDDAAPADWMAARLNLASALATLGERSGDTSLMRRAMALLVETGQRHGAEVEPLLWGMNQSILVGAMRFVAERDGDLEMLEQAVATGERLLEHWTEDRFPLLGASVRNDLANVHQVLGQRTANEAHATAAIALYDEALAVWTRETVPGDWAMATSNRANTLKLLSRLREDVALLAQAIAAYRDVMEVWTRADMPLQWGTAQNNLGDALASLGTLRMDADLLVEAVAAFDAALEEWTLERVPYDWATATDNRGGAKVTLGAFMLDAAEIRDGIADIETAWSFSRDSGVDMWDDYYEHRLARARELLEMIETIE